MQALPHHGMHATIERLLFVGVIDEAIGEVLHMAQALARNYSGYRNDDSAERTWEFHGVELLTNFIFGDVHIVKLSPPGKEEIHHDVMVGSDGSKGACNCLCRGGKVSVFRENRKEVNPPTFVIVFSADV